MSLAAFPEQFWQLGDIRGNPPRLVTREQLGCGAPLGSLSPTQKAFGKETITNLAFLNRYYCAVTIAVDERNV